MPPCRMLRLRALKLCVLALMATAMLMTFRTGFSAWTQTNKQKNRVTSVLKVRLLLLLLLLCLGVSLMDNLELPH